VRFGTAGIGLLGLFALFIGSTPDVLEWRVRQLAADQAWSVVAWEGAQLPSAVSLAVAETARPSSKSDAESILQAYLDGLRSASDRGTEELRLAIAAEIARGLRADGVLPFGAGVFPPVLFTFDRPPRALIVSPRSVIRVAYSELLIPDASPDRVEALEAQISRLNLSALVVEIGGIATYPTLIPPDTPPSFVLQTVAHEWTHTQLFATPLGQAYSLKAEARAINETTADLVGSEIGGSLARALGPASRSAQPAPQAPSSSGPSLQAQLREVRRAVDQLLAEGDVDGAEAFMEEARQSLVAQGYQIRKLNQAYFAFYGSYAEGPGAGGSTEIPDRLRALRARSANLGDFLARVARITSLEDLRAATPDDPPLG
jgi:hypothetical protein